MAQQDIIISQQTANRASRSFVYTSANTIYHLSVGSGLLFFDKSTDGGYTWSDTANRIHMDEVDQHVSAFSIWYDKWTPGDTGTKIHVLYREGTGKNCYYVNLDTSSDTVSAHVLLLDAVANSALNFSFSITKSIGGNLYAGGYYYSTGAVFYSRSTNGGTTWTARSTTGLAENLAWDSLILMPGNEADNQDIYAIYWDTSANELTVKTNDDSADSWAETATISTGINYVSPYPTGANFSATIRDSDNHILVSAWDDYDDAGADLKVWDITNSTTVTAKTNVVTGDAGGVSTGILIDNVTDDLYVFYLSGTVGSNGVTNANVYCKKSTDGGTTWGSATRVNSEYVDGVYDVVYSALATHFTQAYIQTVFFESTWNRHRINAEVPSTYTPIIMTVN